MSLEDQRSSGLKFPATERRTGPSQTETQRISSVENFAIFVLKGIKSQLGNPRAVTVLNIDVVRLIIQACDMEIERIKNIQALRKKK